MLLPLGSQLEKLAIRLVPDGREQPAEQPVELDERLLATPSLALGRCRAVAGDMGRCAMGALKAPWTTLDHYAPELASTIRGEESRCDHYEDALGTYLVKLSAQKLGAEESEEATELLKTIGDFERISDHAVNVLESAEELRSKGLTFSAQAERELRVLTAAIREILTLARRAFAEKDLTAAARVEPLEQVIDALKEQLRTHHILRMQQGACSIEAGFVLVRPAHRSGAHLRPLLQYRRLRAGRRQARPEPPRDAAGCPGQRPGLPPAYQQYAEKYRI